MINCNLSALRVHYSQLKRAFIFLIAPYHPMSNMAYCVLQYLFLFLGALYFAGFVLLVAALTRRTALTIFLCGASYLVCVLYEYVGYIFSGGADYVLGFFYRFGFGGYLLQASYSWSSYMGCGRVVRCMETDPACCYHDSSGVFWLMVDLEAPRRENENGVMSLFQKSSVLDHPGRRTIRPRSPCLF